MLKSTFNYFSSLISNLVILYHVPHFFYLKYFNLLLFYRNLPDRIKSIKIGEDIYFLISNLKEEKFFAFRKQGLMAFNNGIRNRGLNLASAYLLNTISFSDSDYVIDVGANTGDLFIYFNGLNKNINYLGFEPGLREYFCLKNNVGESRCQNIALGDSEAMLKFFYKPEFGDSSLIEMANYSSVYEVKVRKLDDVLNDLNLSNVKIKLLKLEAEGAEPEILNGMVNSLEFFEYIAVDLGFERGVAQDSTLPAVTNFLLSYGFLVQDISRSRLALLFKNTRF
jgi:FkbM family methyltransferase